MHIKHNTPVLGSFGPVCVRQVLDTLREWKITGYPTCSESVVSYYRKDGTHDGVSSNWEKGNQYCV